MAFRSVSQQLCLPGRSLVSSSVKAVFRRFCNVGPLDGKAGQHLILFHQVFRMFVFVLFLFLTKTFIKRSHNDFFTSLYRYSSKKQEQGSTNAYFLFAPARASLYLLIYLAHICEFLLMATHPSAPWQISVKHLYRGKFSFINVKLIKNMCVSDTYHYSEQKLIFFKSNEISLSKKLLPLIIRHVKNYEK